MPKIARRFTFQRRVVTNDPIIAASEESQRTSIQVLEKSSRWRKSTKQLATLGPASSTFEMIEKLFLAGADGFRLNFSHGEHHEKANVSFDWIIPHLKQDSNIQLIARQHNPFY